MRYLVLLLCALLFASGCSEVDKAVETGKQAVEAGKQVVEAGKQAVEAGKQLADSEIAKQLAQYLQQKYDTAEPPLRKAMFSADGKLLVEELKQTELANFSFYKSDLLGVEFRGKLMADGNFQVLRYSLSNPNEQPTVVKEFHVFLDPASGQVQVN